MTGHDKEEITRLKKLLAQEFEIEDLETWNISWELRLPNQKEESLFLKGSIFLTS